MKAAIKLGGIAAIVTASLFAGDASAFPPSEPCLYQGQQTTTPLGQGYNLYECDGTTWFFLLQYWCDDRGNCIPL